MMKNETNMKKMSMEEMENTAAGTVGEMGELVSAMISGGAIHTVGIAASHIPGINLGQKDCVVSDLAKLGIRAEIDLGWAGTGIGSGKNRYYSMKDGKEMSHQEVLRIIGSREVK